MAPISLSANNVGLVLNGRMILSDISARVQTGRWLSIVGANEAGKTSLLHVLAAWRVPTSGGVEVDGMAIKSDDRIRIVLAPGPDDLPGHLLGGELLNIVAYERGRPQFENWDAIVEGLDGHRWLERPINELSLGTRRKVGLATALCGSPQVLLLDEAFDGLDAVASVRIRKIVRNLVDQGQLAVVSASHAWESVFADSDAIVFLEAGKLVRQLGRDEFIDLAAQSKRIQDTILHAFSGKTDIAKPTE